MKPYIEKNDGVPDNNRYSEALEAAKETVEALNKLTDQALAQYTALVDSAVAGHITDERELEHIMDGLLDFGDDLRFLEIYKRLCRYIFYKHPQMVGEHIYLWRMKHRDGREFAVWHRYRSHDRGPDDYTVIFGHGAEFIKKRLLGLERVGIVPNEVMPFYCHSRFPGEDVDSFRHLNHENPDAEIALIEWQPIKPVKLKENAHE